MNKLEFLVQGSAPEPYHVLFQKNGTNLTATCTCPAGEIGQYCKHRLRILAGETTGIISDNAASVPEVQSWLPGSDVEAAFSELDKAELELDAAKKKVSICKKRLAKSLLS